MRSSPFGHFLFLHKYSYRQQKRRPGSSPWVKPPWWAHWESETFPLRCENASHSSACTSQVPGNHLGIISISFLNRHVVTHHLVPTHFDQSPVSCGVCMSSRRFFHTVQKYACDVNWKLLIVTKCVYVCVADLLPWVPAWPPTPEGTGFYGPKVWLQAGGWVKTIHTIKLLIIWFSI